MIPLNDTEPNRYGLIPFVTITLIVVNTLVMFSLPVLVPEDSYWGFLMKYAFTPRLIIEAKGAGMLSSVTAMFLHADFIHLGGNMLALWVFGRRVEDACGPWRFIVFYLLAGTCAHVLTALILYDSAVPSIGASGAIFGVMGAYLILFPEGRIRTLVFLNIVPIWPRIRAIWVVLYFVAIQIIPALNILLSNADYNVGYWAHLGGFFSAILIPLFLRPDAFARYLSDAPV
jgi:membrane associated rhomboid family serine protease